MNRERRSLFQKRLRVYPFKGHFAASTNESEIRVVMDGMKLSGLWLKPWSASLR